MSSKPRDVVWLGLDLGTQSVRALAVNSTGDVLGSGTQPLKSRRTGNRHEQNPEDWWQAVSAASTQALRELTGCTIAGTAVDATSGTVLISDAAGKPLSEGLMYDDARAEAEAAVANEAGSHLWRRLGYHRMQPSWALPKIMWLLNSPVNRNAGNRLLHQTDFINERLTGHPVPTDLSTGLKTGANLITEDWPEDVFDRLDIPQQMLPRLVRSGTRIGTVSEAASRSTCIPAGTPLFAGATDGCAAQIGSGALSVGSWNSVLGTTLVLKGVTRHLIDDPLGIVYSHKGPDGNWLPGGASSTGAGIIARDFPGQDLDILSAVAAGYEPSTMLSYPLVSPGERFPFSSPKAHAFNVGASEHPGDRFAAVMQGIALIEKLSFDYLNMLGAPTNGDIVLTGGATKNHYWNQLRSDILGRPVTLPKHAEPALGMAILAAAAGDQPTAAVAKNMVRIRQVIEPRTAVTERFVDPYRQLIAELQNREWLDSSVAQYAVTGATT